MPVASYLADNGFAGGWPSIFYCTGIACFIWIIVWILMVREKPQHHPFMSQHEMDVILTGRDNVPKKVKRDAL